MRTAVITGGAGGLGRALGAALIARGWHCMALDRTTDGLTPGPQLTAIACDLTDPAQRLAAVDRVLAAGGVDLLIHAAGITHIGALEDQTEAALRRVMEINFFAAAALSRALLQPLRARRGTHLALSSVAGFAPLYHRTAYAASKHALEGFFASLRSEERAHGVRVVVAAPSFVATNPQAGTGADGTARPGSADDGIDAMTPDAAAAAILRGLDRGAEFIPVGRVARLGHWLTRLSPRLYQKVMEARIAGRGAA